MVSDRVSIKEDKPNDNKKPNFCSEFKACRLEKVFPVYALGIEQTESDPESVVSIANLDGDPIWDAVRLEAKLEVCLCNCILAD